MKFIIVASLFFSFASFANEGHSASKQCVVARVDFEQLRLVESEVEKLGLRYEIWQQDDESYELIVKARKGLKVKLKSLLNSDAAQFERTTVNRCNAFGKV